jgi:hypothetical protein
MQHAVTALRRLAGEGIILNNYFTHETCIPSRGALLTGRFAVRLGLQGAAPDFGPELPLSEVTLAQVQLHFPRPSFLPAPRPGRFCS